MEGYKKPICECGADLEYLEEHTVDYIHQVNKNGQINKRYQTVLWTHTADMVASKVKNI
jgi:hypothetical protein